MYSFEVLVNLILVVICVNGLAVTVKRSTTGRDQVTFQTTDRSICSSYGAAFSSYYSYYSTVTCRCPFNKQLFYSVDGKQPTCHSTEATNLGCSGCSGSKCLSSITTLSTPIHWYSENDKFQCSTSGKYTIEKWNGKSWETFERTNDFYLSFETTYPSYKKRTHVYVKWWLFVNKYSAITDYQGNLFLMSLYCGTRKMACFLVTADGSQSYTVEDKDDKEAESKSTKSTAMWIGVGVAAFVVLIISIVCCVVCKRRKGNKSKSARTPTQPNINNKPSAPSYNPSYVIPNINAGQPSTIQHSATTRQPPSLQPPAVIPMQQTHTVFSQPPTTVPMQPQFIHMQPPTMHIQPVPSCVQVISQPSQVMYTQSSTPQVIMNPMQTQNVIYPGQRNTNGMQTANRVLENVGNGIELANNVCEVASGLSNLTSSIFG